MRPTFKRRPDEAAVRLAAGMASYALDVPVDEIFHERRGKSGAACARQVAMYLCYVGLELSLSRVAEAFERDRSTISHACQAMEARREDPLIDAWLGALEAALREAIGLSAETEGAA